MSCPVSASLLALRRPFPAVTRNGRARRNSADGVEQGEGASSRSPVPRTPFRVRGDRRFRHAWKRAWWRCDQEGRPVRRALAFAAIIAAVATSAVVAFAGPASADPSADDWYQLRMCESTNRYTINTGNVTTAPISSTCRPAIGRRFRDPNEASARSRTTGPCCCNRQRGWEPWVCAYLVGLTEDGDARSGGAAPVSGNQSSGSGVAEGSSSARPRPGAGLSGSAVLRGRLLRGPQGLAEADGHPRATTWSAPATSVPRPRPRSWICRPRPVSTSSVHRAQDVAAAWADSGAAAPAPAASGSSYTPQTNESCGVGQPTAPAWPGRQFVQGDTALELQCFQKQLASRGYPLTGNRLTTGRPLRPRSCSCRTPTASTRRASSAPRPGRRPGKGSSHPAGPDSTFGAPNGVMLRHRPVGAVAALPPGCTGGLDRGARSSGSP